MVSVPKAIPEKQGLKLAVNRSWAWIWFWVPKAIPEKQGLKHEPIEEDWVDNLSPKGHSRKTRIETGFINYRVIQTIPIVPKAIPEKQGLKQGGGEWQ